MENLMDNPINLLILVGAGILIISILMKVAKSIFKIALTVVVLGLAWYFWQGGSLADLKDEGVRQLFKKAAISDMKDIYCDGEKAEKTKCICIITPVYDDLHARYSISEIREIEKDEDQVMAEIRLSLQRRNKEIRSCLTERKGSQYLNILKHVWGEVKETVSL